MLISATIDANVFVTFQNCFFQREFEGLLVMFVKRVDFVESNVIRACALIPGIKWYIITLMTATGSAGDFVRTLRTRPVNFIDELLAASNV